MPPSSNWANYMRMLDREPLRSETFHSLNLAGLEAVATSHRGSNCRVNKSCYAYGGDNIILEIVFADSSVWIARLRLHEPKFLQPRGEVDKIFLTEVATLGFLKRRTKIPVPTVFAYDARFQNEIGQPFMLMEGMPGKRLWGGMQTDYIPDEFKGKVYGQIADIMLELHSHPFQEIGMLYCEETNGGGNLQYGSVKSLTSMQGFRSSGLSAMRLNFIKPEPGFSMNTTRQRPMDKVLSTRSKSQSSTWQRLRILPMIAMRTGHFSSRIRIFRFQSFLFC